MQKEPIRVLIVRRLRWAAGVVAVLALLLFGTWLFILIDNRRSAVHKSATRARAAEMVLAWLLGESPESSGVTVNQEEFRLWTITHLKAANRIGIASPFISELEKFKDPRLFRVSSTDPDAIRGLSSKGTVVVAIVPVSTNPDDVDLVVRMASTGELCDYFVARVREQDGGIRIDMAAIQYSLQNAG